MKTTSKLKSSSLFKSIIPLLGMLSLSTQAAVNFYVSSQGSDGNNGSINSPWKSIAKAKSHIRTINSNMNDDIIVNLRGGVYQLNDTLTFTTADSATNNYTITYQSYQNEKAHPNIILFLVDDMGWQDTSVSFADIVTPANKHFHTPNMEQLAKQGIKFTQAYSHSVCSPSRVSMMTGQNPTRHHVSNWTLRANQDHSGLWGPTAPPKHWRMEGIQANDITLPKLLKKSGYLTIHVGKAHFGAIETSGADPLNLGFDYNIGGHSSGAPASYLGENSFGNDMPIINNIPNGVPHLDEYHHKKIHLTDALTKKAKALISSASQSKKPFFLNMAHYAVHTPIEPHPRLVSNYQNKTYEGTNIDIPTVEENYASLIEGMDASLGDLMQHLNNLGIAENTLIIFTSDNGGLSGHTRETTPKGTELNSHNWPLKSGKASAHEGGTRVPYIAAWAKSSNTAASQKKFPIAVNSTSKQPIIIEDLFPTILSVANASEQIPQDYKVDGHDVSSNWLLPKQVKHRALLFHYPHVWGPHGPGYQPHSAMRLGDWKIIYYYNSQTWKLYNLASDLSEEINLADKNKKRLKKLAKQLKTELEAKAVQWPINRLTKKSVILKVPH